MLNIYAFNRLTIYILFVCFLISLSWFSNKYILNDTFYYSILENNFSEERVRNFVEFNDKYQWLNYMIIPIMLLFKWVALSGILYIGLFFYNQNVAYKNCFKIMQMAELAMLLAASAKLIYFIFNTPQTIQDVQYFYPLAITQFFTLKQIASYLVYPLQQFNLFELGYWVLITSGIQTFTQKNFWQSLKITASSYGVAMFIWLLFIVFIQLQFS